MQKIWIRARRGSCLCSISPLLSLPVKLSHQDQKNPNIAQRKKTLITVSISLFLYDLINISFFNRNQAMAKSSFRLEHPLRSSKPWRRGSGQTNSTCLTRLF